MSGFKLLLGQLVEDRHRGSISNFASAECPATFGYGEKILLCSYPLTEIGNFQMWFSKGMSLHSCTVTAQKALLIVFELLAQTQLNWKGG